MCINTYIYIYIYIYIQKTELTEKRKYVFPDRQIINGNLRVLFQQTCPSMILANPAYPTFCAVLSLDC